MGKTELNIVIDENGTVSCEVKGIKGKGCIKIMEMVEQILGKAKTKKFTSEYYELEAQIKETVEVKK